MGANPFALTCRFSLFVFHWVELDSISIRQYSDSCDRHLSENKNGIVAGRNPMTVIVSPAEMMIIAVLLCMLMLENELDGWGEARNARICTHLLPVIADHISITSFEDRLSCKESSP
jgi:hypothetical protein